MPVNNLSQVDVAAIVQEVLRRLERMGTAGETNEPSSSTAPQGSNDRQLRCAMPVISVQALADRLDGVRQVVVSQRAIVTPAARDEFRDRGIELVRSASVTGDSATGDSATGDSEMSDSAMGECLVAGDVAMVNHEQARSIHSDEQWATFFSTVVDGERVALAICRRPHRTACLANRHDQLRAVAVEELGCLERIVQEANANVVCIHASLWRRTSLRLLRQRIIDAMGERS